MAAGVTDRIRLVTNHLNNNIRAAPLLAKMAATLDVISNGRLELFLSPGAREREHTSYGFCWESDPAVRVQQLAEAVQLVRALWTAGPVDFDGEFYHLRAAISAPGPTRSAGPPIWIGGPLDEPTTDLIATYADGWNSFPTALDTYGQKAALVDEACQERSRDPRSLRRSLETQVLILDTATEWDDWLQRWAGMRERLPLGDAVSDLVAANTSFDAETVTASCVDTFIVGTRDEVEDKIRHYRDLGVTEIVCWFMDFPSARSMNVLATEIRPRLDAAAASPSLKRMAFPG